MLAKIKNPVENGILEIDLEKAIKMQDAGYGEVEHVAIFDEDQCEDWATIVCLVGGGQEISVLKSFLHLFIHYSL